MGMDGGYGKRLEASEELKTEVMADFSHLHLSKDFDNFVFILNRARRLL